MTDDELQNRYAERFADDEDADQGNDADGTSDSGSDESAVRSNHEGNDKSAQNVWNAQNIKKDWKGWTVYLPEHYLNNLKDDCKRADLKTDREMKLDRHLKPVLIALGREQLNSMEGDELEEFVERMEQGEIDE